VQQQGTTGLVLNGILAYKGQFPWFASLFYNGKDNNGFICGGSLVSKRIVVTAAHCVQNKNTFSAIQAEDSFFYLGKYYSSKLADERGFVLSGVVQFYLHPSWNINAKSFDADIAIAVLTKNVQFSNVIQPICIWTATNNKNDIINQQGIVAGYGKTQFSSSASEKPYWSKLPVADDASCLRSNQAFSEITSDRTFCAGARDGSGPCNGW
jgi:hypothetical protein